MSNPDDYTVGWICAITTEYVAAQEFLDEEHDGPEYVSPNDNNHYTLGRVGRHNVVIAVLPDNEYGKSSAAGVARDMMHSFPNVRIGLMVGIGGGAPGKHDIRLGDVVVSSGSTDGGVLGYDFGKDIQGQYFQITGFLNRPPTLLRTAMTGLKAQYERKGHQLSEAVNTILEKNKRLRKKYKQPGTANDRLFKSEVTHDSTCAGTCRYDEENLVSRPERDEDEDYPVIHYGLIASADTLMKNALDRDRLSEEHNVLCFEMEAAGLMNHFPCLVIRGICDYSDSYKSKAWQGYAAMVAAAYAKDLLNQIGPNRVEAESRIRDILLGFQDVAQEYRDIAKEQLQVQKDQAKERLSKEQQKCHQLFRLTTSSKDATYEWYKGRVEERTEGTCMWFLRHNHFQTWLNQESGPLLVSADPGCGKSVLAKYLIDHALPRSATICYFFFKDEDQNTVRQALCALLHQLFSLKPALIEHAMPQFRQNGQGLINSTESLWDIFQRSLRDPYTGSVIVVLDALDECAESEFADLMQNVEKQFRGDQAGYGKLKYLLTCRPYNQILSEFRTLLYVFPEIHIPGEEESETIAEEVNHVIKLRVNQLAMKKRFTAQMKKHVETRLQEANHRTYLWVYLVFDYLQKQDFKKTVKGFEFAIATLPTSVNDAYEEILNSSNKDPMVRKALCIILAANRPLTLSEMNIAVNVDETVESMDDLDLEGNEDFKRRLRSWCGLFVSVHHGSVYFLHQTAREFLLTDSQSPTNIPSGLCWHHSISNSDAHDVLATVCVLYLNFFNIEASLSQDKDVKASGFDDKNLFLVYSAQNWSNHSSKADITDSATIIPFVRRICDTDSKSFSVWYNIYCRWKIDAPEDCTDLIIASYVGHLVLVKFLLEEGAEIESRDNRYLLPSLSWAAWEGHADVVKLLLERGANINTNNNTSGMTPLYLSLDHGHQVVVKLLLENGADVNAKGSLNAETPLYLAAEHGQNDIIKLLLEKGADINKINASDGETPLNVAAWQGEDSTLTLLLEKGADIHQINPLNGRTPIHDAAQQGHNVIIRLLLEKGADVNGKDKIEYTPLIWASDSGHKGTVRLLLDNGASIESRDKKGQTALDRAYAKGHYAIVNLLIDRGARFD